MSNCKNENALDAEIRDQYSYDKLKENFQNPTREYGVNCCWWWLNGNVTKEAITKDLEAMRARNFQGAVIVDAGGKEVGSRPFQDSGL